MDKAIEVYNEILSSAPFSPSYVSYRNLTKGLVEAGRIDEAVDYLREMINKGNGADSLVFNNLILGFLNLGNLDKAIELFDELKERCSVYDGVVTATFMDWFFKNGRDKEAMDYYRDLLGKEFKMVPATCNVLLETLLRHERTTEAWALFDTMLDRHTPPTFQGVNSETFSIMVNEHCRIGKVLEAIDVFKRVGKKVGSKPFSMDVAGFNNMIIRYCEHDMMEDAEKIFNELCSKSLNPDVTTYKTLIDSYFRVGRVEEALQKYIKMVEAGLRVIPGYANKWFGILIENGKVVECAPILKKIGEKDPKPDFNTYDLVIRALCNENNFDLSIDLVGQMQRYGVGVTDSLKGFLNEEFGKVGRGKEVEKILTMRGQGYYGYSRPGPPPGNFRMPGAISGQVPTDSRYNSLPPGGNFRMPEPHQGYNNAAPRGNFQMPGPNSERLSNDLRYNNAASQGNFRMPGPNSGYNNAATFGNFRMQDPNSEQKPTGLSCKNAVPCGNYQMPGSNSEQLSNDLRYNNAAPQGSFHMPSPNLGYNNSEMPGNIRMQGPNSEQVATNLGYNNAAPTENLQMTGPNSEQKPNSSYDNAEVNRNYLRAYY